MKGSTASLLPEEKNRGQGFSVWKRYSGTQYTHTAFSCFPRHLLCPLTQETLGENQHDKNQCNRHRKCLFIHLHSLFHKLCSVTLSHLQTRRKHLPKRSGQHHVHAAPRKDGSYQRLATSPTFSLFDSDEPGSGGIS